MNRLVDDGWVTPADPGPGRRWRIGMAMLAIPLLAWVVLVLVSLSFASDQTVDVHVSDDGSAYLVVHTSSGKAQRPLRAELRTSRGTRFLVVRGAVPSAGTDRITVRVKLPVGTQDELVAVRYAEPRAWESDGRLLVVIPASQLPDVTGRSKGSLGELTAPMDERVRQTARDRRLRGRMQRGWWWIAPLGLLVTVLAPLRLWRRETHRFFSMRVPGPGRKIDTVPPSSLDPVGAAVLLAGARPVDAAAAFTGHVLDLVERRQLRFRRNADPEAGAIGAQLGLAHADEEAVPDDIAVAALRRAVREDAVTVDVPDDPTRATGLPPDSCVQWHAHVAARARFERAADSYPAPRIAAAAAATVAFALAGLIGALFAEYSGGQVAGALVLALALPLAIVLGAWAVDARRWRIVARERRTERAQWVAWRAAVGTSEGPGLDPRNIPLVAATGPVTGLIRETAPKDAVGLEAVTVRSVETLRVMCLPGSRS